MIQRIIDGISVKINEEFGDEAEIYTETVKQDFEEGSFTLSCINPTSKQFLGNRYFRTHLFCVRYFPKTKEPKIECYEVLERLYSALEYITVDGKLCRGTNMHGEVSDDFLSFFVNYDVFVYKDTEEKEPMEVLNHNGEVKGS